MKRVGFTRDVLLNNRLQMRNGMIASMPYGDFARLNAYGQGGVLDLTPKPTACAFGMIRHSPDVVRTYPCPTCRHAVRFTVCETCGSHGYLIEP